jgi:predicted ATPase
MLPTGTVTFLFTDVEGSTRLLHELGEARYAEVLAAHRSVVRLACARHAGVEVDTQGDAFFVAFETAPEALRAAAELTEALAAGPVRVRAGLHTGTPLLSEEGYVGVDVHRAARIAAAGHGGQVLVSQSTASLARAELLDLGDHRLKDFDEPVRLFQLGTDGFPPLKTLNNTNLPVPASSFVGRDRELAEVTSLLRDDGARLVTLTGPGGSGKTRLAIEAAADAIGDCPDGVFWVGLAGLRDPALVLETIADALGAKGSLAEHVGSRTVLVLLDNFEHVVDAAAGVSDLLGACRNLRLLVTSRELLRIRGEVDYPVPPLAQGDAEDLFIARSRLPRDDDVAGLCRRLDNMPLAVELAAARTKTLSPDEILERLGRRLDLFRGGRDADPRQTTLRATIDWSYDLLDESEKVLFARLAVFEGGCTLAAAETLCAADIDVLDSLVSKSLLRRTRERFWMLETIRAYAVERLEASAEGPELRARHARFYMEIAESLQERDRRRDAAAREQLDGELSNLRQALAHAASLRDAELLGGLVWGMWFYWATRGLLREGEHWAAIVDDVTGRPATLREARGLLGASEIARSRLHLEQAASMKERAARVLRELGEEGMLAATFADLAEIQARLGRFEAAREWAAAAVALRRSLGAPEGVGHAHFAAGVVEFAAGAFAAARDFFDEALTVAPTAHPTERAYIIAMIGDCHRRLGHLSAASAALAKAVALAAGADDRPFVLELLQQVAAVVDDGAAAAALLAASERIRSETGAERYDPVDYESTLEHVRKALAGGFEDAWARGGELADAAALELAAHALQAR